ncbi:MAG: efflux RND transporter periplasmic adaptor subunit [Steroidobacteraceae bacterium]
MVRLDSVRWIVGSVLLTFLMSACSRGSAPTAVVASSLVRVTKPVSGPGAAPIVTTGVVAAADEMRLSFKLGGVVQRIVVHEGQQVSAGQILAELEPAEINAQLTQAQQLNDKAQRDLERGERLHADQVITLEQLQNLRTQAKVAAAQLQSASFNSGFARITAPSAGTVLRKLVEDNEVVAPGQPVLVLGASRKGYIVRAALADREAVQLQLGDTATVQLDALPGKTLTGHVSVVGGAAQLENGLFPIEIQLDATGDRLVAGLVAQTSIQTAAARKSSLLYVPTGAVVAGVGRKASVYVLQQDGTAQKRDIQVAFFTRDRVALSGGLNADEQVITDGALYLSDGEKVSIQAAE